VPIDFDFKKCRWTSPLNYSSQKITQIFKNYEFQSLIERLPELKKTKKDDKIKERKIAKQKTLF
jgi:hypothetical protein